MFTAASRFASRQFSPGGATSTLITQITPIGSTGYNQNMIISVASGSANLTATMDGGASETANTFYQNGVNTAVTSAGVT